MTQRQRHRQHLLWTVDRWMRRHGLWFVFALYLSAGTAGTAFAAELKSTEQTSPLMKMFKPVQNTAKPADKKESAKKEVVKDKRALPDMDAADEKAEGELRKVKGIVSGSSRYGIAVEHGMDANSVAQEMWANYLSSTTLSGAKKFSDLQYGDTVELTYKELKDGQKRLLKSVKLISKKPKETPNTSSGVNA